MSRFYSPTSNQPMLTPFRRYDSAGSPTVLLEQHYWCLLGAFGVTAMMCLLLNIPVTQKFWLPGGLIYISERVLREVRARHTTYISKVVQHPGKVCEVQIKKDHTTRRAGQYIFINCPEVSYFQYRESVCIAEWAAR